MKRALSHVAAASLVAAMLATPGVAQPADTALVNGKVLTLDAGATVAEALAVRDDKIVAVGRSADIRALAGPATRLVDLGGRTVIPGLIDSHMHAIRAALFYATEVNWIGSRSIPEAMARITAAAPTPPSPASGSSSPAVGPSSSSRGDGGRPRPSSSPRHRTIPSISSRSIRRC